MKKFFSLFSALLFAGSLMAETITITPSSGFKSSYGEGTFTLSEVEFAYAGACYTGKGTPTGYASKQFIQLRKSANGAGEVKNNDAINLKSIVIATQNDKAFTLKVGTSADALSAADDPVKTTGKYACKDADDKNTECDVTIYTFDVTGKKYFDLVNGSSAQYLAYITIEYEAAPAPAVAKPAISGKGNFIGETEISISCTTDGATIYYTLDGTEPASTSTEYTAKFTINASKTVKAIAIKGSDKSEIVQKVFTKYEAKTCAEAAALEADAITGLNEVTVTYVKGSNIYVKDATGYELIYASGFGLKAGDVVNGFIGKSAPFNGLPELKPDGIITKTDLEVVSGTAPDPEEITAAPTAADINKYLIIKGVSVEAGSFTTSSATSLNATIGEETFVLRNNFKIAATFEAGKKYDIVGAGAIYQKDETTTLQIYFISATEQSGTALDNTASDTKAVKTIVNGQLIIEKAGVKYNVLGQSIR